jgi:hypothetical protein
MVDFSFLPSTTKVISEPLKMQMHFEMYSSFALASSPIPITVDQLGIHVAHLLFLFPKHQVLSGRGY